MKYTDLFEDVVDIAAARQKKQHRDVMDRTAALSKEFEDYDRMEQDARDELGEILFNMTTMQEKLRVPGFDNYDDVAAYLMADLGLPRQPGKWKEWYDELDKREQAKVMMIAHHAKRIVKSLTDVRSQLTAFQNRWWSAFEKLETPEPDLTYLIYRHKQKLSSITKQKCSLG